MCTSLAWMALMQSLALILLTQTRVQDTGLPLSPSLPLFSSASSRHPLESVCSQLRLRGGTLETTLSESQASQHSEDSVIVEKVANLPDVEVNETIVQGFKGDLEDLDRALAGLPTVTRYGQADDDPKATGTTVEFSDVENPLREGSEEQEGHESSVPNLDSADFEDSRDVPVEDSDSTRKSESQSSSEDSTSDDLLTGDGEEQHAASFLKLLELSVPGPYPFDRAIREAIQHRVGGTVHIAHGNYSLEHQIDMFGFVNVRGMPNPGLRASIEASWVFVEKGGMGEVRNLRCFPPREYLPVFNIRGGCWNFDQLNITGGQMGQPLVSVNKMAEVIATRSTFQGLRDLDQGLQGTGLYVQESSAAVVRGCVFQVLEYGVYANNEASVYMDSCLLRRNGHAVSISQKAKISMVSSILYMHAKGSFSMYPFNSWEKTTYTACTIAMLNNTIYMSPDLIESVHLFDEMVPETLVDKKNRIVSEFPCEAIAGSHLEEKFYYEDGTEVDICEFGFQCDPESGKLGAPTFELPPGWRYEHVDKGYLERRDPTKRWYETYYFNDEEQIMQGWNPIVSERHEKWKERHLRAESRKKERAAAEDDNTAEIMPGSEEASSEDSEA